MTDIGRLKELEAKATKGEWSAVLPGDPRGQPSPMYRGLVCLVKHDGGGALAVVADSDFVSPKEWAANTAFIAELRNAAPHLLSEIETLRTQSGSLFDAIQHGDDEHRAWLKAAITAHFAGEPVPPPSGSGRKDAEIETLRAELERLKAALAWYADSPEPGTFKIVTGDGDFISDLSTWGDRARDALAYNKSKVTT